MKNVIYFLLSAIPLLASNVNPTAPLNELTNYGADFTDTDGDGMTDVAELRYGFDPNDKNSYPSTDYTVLSEFGSPQLHESTGVDDPKNEIRFMFTSSDYALNRKGLNNFDKLTSDREFLNLAMPILLHELGAPPESFIIEIRCQNRGVYANGYKISVNDDSPPSSFLHEIGHAWKRGWDYSWMNGKNRRYMRGFEEGFAEALVYHIQNRFVEAYPNHPLVKSKMVTGRNAQTWRGDVYNFDVTLGEKALRGGTFFGDRFTQYRYENSSGAFSVMANQRDGVLKDMLQSYYKKIAEGSWDRTLDVNETFDLWADVLPTVNGIDTKQWLTRVGLFSGKPAPQELYVSLIDEKVFILYPDRIGNFSWKHGTPSSQNIPSWFPTKNDGGKYTPNVGGIAFNLNVTTINDENVLSLSRKTNSGTLGETKIDEIAPHNLPVGLYRASVEVPFFASQSPNNKTTSYIIGGKHTNHPHDKLSVHVGLDVPTAEKIELNLGEKTYTTSIVNGLAIFRFNDVGIDFTGSVSISVTASGKTLEYKRAISQFGLGSGQRLNQFLIVDTDLDNVEDAYDSDVVGLQSKTFAKFSEIQSNAEQIANPTTSVITQSKDNLSSKPKPKLPNVPTTPPSATNPILELETKIKTLETRVNELIGENSKLASTNTDLSVEVNYLRNEISAQNKLLENALLNVASLQGNLASASSENQQLVSKLKNLELVNQNLETKISDIEKQMKSTSTKNEKTFQNFEVVVDDLNKTVNDINSTLVQYELNATKQKNKISSLTAENVDLLNQIAELKSKLNQLNDADTQNQKLNNDIVEHTNTIKSLVSQNQSLNSNNDALSNSNAELTSELTEAIRVAQVPFTSGWFYDPEDGWLYTDASVFPLIYKHSSESWYFYELGSHDSRYFFSYKTNEWEEWK
tara:strand:+ start:598 stop:3333 length:2736 start_codon:yes stop_codon:yes gene_type:complete